MHDEVIKELEKALAAARRKNLDRRYEFENLGVRVDRIEDNLHPTGELFMHVCEGLLRRVERLERKLGMTSE